MYRTPISSNNSDRVYPISYSSLNTNNSLNVELNSFFNQDEYSSFGKIDALSESLKTVRHNAQFNPNFFDRSFDFTVSNNENLSQIIQFNNCLYAFFKLIDLFSGQKIVFSKNELAQIKFNYILSYISRKISYLKNTILDYVNGYLNPSFSHYLRLQFCCKSLFLNESFFNIHFSLNLFFCYYSNVDVAQIIQNINTFINSNFSLAAPNKYIVTNDFIKHYKPTFDVVFELGFSDNIGNILKNWIFINNNLDLLFEIINDPYIKGVPSLSLEKQRLVYLNNFLSLLQNRISCVRSQITAFLDSNVGVYNTLFFTFNLKSLKLTSSSVDIFIMLNISFYHFNQIGTALLVESIKNVILENYFFYVDSFLLTF